MVAKLPDSLKSLDRDEARWQRVCLGDLIDIRHGFAFKGEFFSDDPPGDVLLTPGNFAIGGGLKTDKLKYYDGPVPADFVLPEGALLITMTDLSKNADTLGFPAIVPKATDSRYLHNQRLGLVFIRDNVHLDVRFLFYRLCTAEYRHEIVASATGTTVKHTSPDRIKAFRFPLPPIDEQKAIAHILGTLDDKIELNRRMNRTLEAIARAIFKSWFVDFDPVKAKAEGRTPVGMDSETAALFADSFQDSPLGPIPDGWRVGVLDEVLAVIETGGRPRGGVRGITEGVPSIGAESIVGLGIFDFSKTKLVPRVFYESMRRGCLLSRDVLLYKDGGRPGEFEPHVSMFGDGFPFTVCAINEHVYRLRTNGLANQAYLYFWLHSDLVMEEMRVKGTGVAIPGLNSTNAKSLTTLIPHPRVLAVFHGFVEPFITAVFRNCNESRTLAAIRGVLLPKLLSGEIRIKDAELFAEEVA